MYEIHRQAGDAHLELWPDDDILAVLAYTRSRFPSLPPAQSSPLRRKQLIARAELTRLVYAQLDSEQLGLLDQARPREQHTTDYPVYLKDLAPAMGLKDPSGVNQRHNRLLAAVNNLPRLPREGRRVLRERAERTRTDFLKMQAAQAHHNSVRRAAHALLDVVDELVLSEDAEDWIDELQEMADENLQLEEMVGFAARLNLLVQGVANEGSLSPDAAQALEGAREALAYRRPARDR
ncbi:hypothetical protein ABZ234_08205 [Nocardiopsis sp. NPDC006198]|uniref:hypothetical protein n=1 Tax=Nocardiopsis sp. NPDC006198 TaxID=3154472 RepID=UPI0033BA8DC5